MEIQASDCYECKNFNITDPVNFACKAFPKGIPNEIIDGDVKHNKPYEGDNGIQFEKK